MKVMAARKKAHYFAVWRIGMKRSNQKRYYRGYDTWGNNTLYYTLLYIYTIYINHDCALQSLRKKYHSRTFIRYLIISNVQVGQNYLCILIYDAKTKNAITAVLIDISAPFFQGTLPIIRGRFL